MRQVRIVASNPDIDISVDMGNGPALITGGLGGWQAVERLEDVAATQWTGQPPIEQSVPLMLDGYRHGVSVEHDLSILFRLGRDAKGDENVPPVFKVTGPIHFSADDYPNMRWVLPDGGIELDGDSVIRENDGTLVRQGLTLHLLEYVKPDEIKLRGKKKTPKSQRGEPGKTGGTAFPGKSYTTQQGDTLESIAGDLYGDWRMWHEIGKLNNLHDPKRTLKPGTKLRLP